MRRLSKLVKKEKIKVLLLGLDGAGKTAILKKLKLKQFVETSPTERFNEDTVDHRNVKLSIWDLGGKGSKRLLWRHFYTGTQAVMFIVDSADRGRVREAGRELWRLLHDPQLRDVVVLVLANKQDVAAAMDAPELQERLGLARITDRKWLLQAVCASTGAGLDDALDWLTRNRSSPW